MAVWELAADSHKSSMIKLRPTDRPRPMSDAEDEILSLRNANLQTRPALC